jgi:predicted NUDIX family NTP pyrophosphohydrolase
VRRSAGLLLFRRRGEDVELLVAHMGGPFWARKDAHAWSIPKGEFEEGEDPIAAARREFAEELGASPPGGDPVDLGEVRQSGGKRVHVWAVEGDLDADAIVSNTFEIEWPRGSARMQAFPEVDRAAWVAPDVAREKLVKGQVAFVDRLLETLGPPGR